MSTLKFLKSELSLLKQKQSYLSNEIEAKKNILEDLKQEFDERADLIYCLEESTIELEKNT